MTDSVERNTSESTPLITVIDSAGNETDLTIRQVNEAVARSKEEQDKFADKNISVVGHTDSGLLEIELHLHDPHEVFDYVPLPTFGEDSGIKAGRYYVITDKWLEDNKAVGISERDLKAMMINGAIGGLLLTSDENQTVGNIGLIPVTIRESNDDGSEPDNPSYEPMELFMLVEAGTQHYVSTYDLIASLYVISSVNIAISDYEQAKAPRRERKKKYSSPTKEIKWPNDPATIALMDRNEGHIEPADYFTGGRDINTGGGGSIKLTVNADESVEIDAESSVYVLDNETNFWYTMLCNVARDTGKKEIYGTDILKLAGYQNPYRDDSAEVMASASSNIYKAIRTTIAVDTTNERRNKKRKNREVIESIGLRPVVSADMDLTKEAVKDDKGNKTGEIVQDFVVTLKPRNDEVMSAFPLFEYAESRDMVLTIGKDEYLFDGLRLSLDDRRMWMYVLRRVKSQKLSNIIKFETMWNTLELKKREYKPVPETDEDGNPRTDDEGKIIYKKEDAKVIARKQSEALRKKKTRMIAQLEKMLYQASGGLNSGQRMKKGDKAKYPRRIAAWEWTKDKSSGRVDGVKITPLKSAT